MRVNEFFVTSGGREGVDVTAPNLISVVDWQARAPCGLTLGLVPEIGAAFAKGASLSPLSVWVLPLNGTCTVGRRCWQPVKIRTRMPMLCWTLTWLAERRPLA